MVKSRLLKSALKSNTSVTSNEPDPSTLRPRTAGGEKGLLRRLRIGRIFFGLGSGPSSSADSGNVYGAGAGSSLGIQQYSYPQSARMSGSESDLLARSSRPAPVPLLPGTEPRRFAHKDPPSEGMQTISAIQRHHNNHIPQAIPSEAQKNRFSVMSRRSSAPDIVKLARQLSRCTESSTPRSSDTSARDSPLPSPSESQCSLTRTPGAKHGSSSSDSGLSKTNDPNAGLPIAHRTNEADCPTYYGADVEDDDLNSICALYSRASSRASAVEHGKVFPDIDQIDEDYKGSSVSVEHVEPVTQTIGPGNISPKSTHYRQHLQQTGLKQDTQDDGSYRGMGSPHSAEHVTEFLGAGGENISSNKALSEAASISGIYDMGLSVSPMAGSRRDLVDIYWQHGSSESRRSDEMTPMTFSWKGLQSSDGSLYSQPPPIESSLEYTADKSVDDLEVILMGSVKYRGEKKYSRQPSVSGTSQQSSQPYQSLSPQPSHPAKDLLEYTDGESAGLPDNDVSSTTPGSDSSEKQHGPAPVLPPIRPVPFASRKSIAEKSIQTYSPYMNTRPKSLYELASTKARLDAQSSDAVATKLSSGSSSSIASAKAFLTMIAFGEANTNVGSSAGVAGLSVVTTQPHINPRHGQSCGNPVSPVLASAPLEVTEPILGICDADKDAGANGSPDDLDSINDSKPHKEFDSADKGDLASISLGVSNARSLRTRSKLASVGIRRASTYVWNRSSVFMRSLSSADELPASPELKQPPQQQQQQLQKPQNASSWETDADTGSTKTEEHLDGELADKGPEHHAVVDGGLEKDVPSKAQQYSSAALARRKSPAAMRLHAARELVMTEKNFVDNLFVIKKVWMEPVFSSANSPKPIIPYQAARIIFFGITALHSHASQFYRDMDYALGSFERGHRVSGNELDDGVRIGSLFSTRDRHWGDFISFVRNYGAAVNSLKHLQDYKPYMRYHEECMLQKRTNRQSLKDLLMLPIQRITRYTLLLKNVLKHTPAMHGDHIDLCRAVKNATNFASIVNECRRKQEEVHRLIEIFRTIEQCPPLPHSESRSFISEYFVRELISRLPTRLLLFSDMLVVAQTSAQAKTDEAGNIDPTAQWSYYGCAFLDDVEIQNADETTSTLITILSLNRRSASSLERPESTRHSLPSSSSSGPSNATAVNSEGSSSGSIPGMHTHVQTSSLKQGSDINVSMGLRGKPGQGGYGPATSSYLQGSGTASSDGDPLHAGGKRDKKKKKSKSRKGLLQTNSRESIPDHIAALSHSTFPSPVPCPNQIEGSSTQRMAQGTSMTSSDILFEYDSRLSHPKQQQQQQQSRPKTSSGNTVRSSPAHAHLGAALHSGSYSTLVNNNNGLLLGETPTTFRAHSTEASLNGSASMQALMASRTDLAPMQPVQLTLVMQHASSVTRKQFVRALKDASARCSSLPSSLNEFDMSNNDSIIAADSSSEILSLQPL
ncbi:hypothetical protein LPJ59_001566 [Coemansia sp. RSA 2399]|nr:hypothetical protein LPJ59_001566 [Coemansia sp. RSA 2399]